VATSAATTDSISPAPPVEKIHVVRHSLDTNTKIPFNVAHRVDRINSAGPTINFQKIKNDFMIANTAASMRVLNILRHWVTKHGLDFSENVKLKEDTINLIYDMLGDPHLTETEKKVARGIAQQLNSLQEKTAENSRLIEMLLMPPAV
jgi:hypothetical protein